MMKLRFDKRLDESMMKAYCIDYQIIGKVLINSSEISSLRLRWETAVALRAEAEHAGHIIVSSRKRQSWQAVYSVFPSMQDVQTFYAVQVCFRRNQVQSATPLEKPREASYARTERNDRCRHSTDISAERKYRSLLGDFPHASLRVR